MRRAFASPNPCRVPCASRPQRRSRYLAPEGKTSRLRIYVEQGGVWQSVPFETVGSYAVFSIPAASARIAAVSTMPVWWIWAAIPLLLALIIFLMIHFIRKAVRKSKQKRAAQSAPQNAPLVPAGVSAVAAGSDPQPPAAVPAEERRRESENGNDFL